MGSSPKEIGLEVIAEGVENEDQLNFLKQQECDQIQGFLFSKSISIQEFEKVLRVPILKPIHKREGVMSIENRRKFYRISFDYPLGSKMTIVEIKGKKVNLGSSKVLIENISLGGLRFLDVIDLPVQSNEILKFTTLILDEEIELTGSIKWKHEIENELFQYGIEFMLTDIERNKLAPLLSQLGVQLKENPLLQGCNFIIESRSVFFS